MPYSGDNDVVDVVLYDSSGSLFAVKAEQGITRSTQPSILMSAASGSVSKLLHSDKIGNLYSRRADVPTYVLYQNVATANDKSLVSIYNGGTKIVKISSVRVRNSRTSFVFGTICTLGAFRFTGSPSGGSDITSQAQVYDTDNPSLTSQSISLKTGATINNESAYPLYRTFAGTGGWDQTFSDPEFIERLQQIQINWFEKIDSGFQSITLRNGEGLTIKCETNTTTGIFDIHMVFTVE